MQSTEARGPKVRTRDSIKRGFDQKWLEHDYYYKVLKSVTDQITRQLKAPLVEIMDYINRSLGLHSQGGKNYEIGFNLSDDELQFLAIKLPATCLYVQEKLNDYSLSQMVSEYLTEYEIAEKLKGIRGGDARERIRFAQQQAEMDVLTTMIKKHVVQDLKSSIERADKVYEGIKKVLDGKNREKSIFMKT